MGNSTGGSAVGKEVTGVWTILCDPSLGIKEYGKTKVKKCFRCLVAAKEQTNVQGWKADVEY